MTATEHNTYARYTRPGAIHEHAWLVESRHSTSAGLVVYVKCGTCKTRRVDIQDRVESPPTAVSKEVATPRRSDSRSKLSSSL